MVAHKTFTASGKTLIVARETLMVVRSDKAIARPNKRFFDAKSRVWDGQKGRFRGQNDGRWLVFWLLLTFRVLYVVHYQNVMLIAKSKGICGQTCARRRITNSEGGSRGFFRCFGDAIFTQTGNGKTEQSVMLAGQQR